METRRTKISRYGNNTPGFDSIEDDCPFPALLLFSEYWSRLITWYESHPLHKYINKANLITLSLEQFPVQWSVLANLQGLRLCRCPIQELLVFELHTSGYYIDGFLQRCLPGLPI